MLLVQDDDVIQEFTADAANPALSDSVLPGTAKGGSYRLASHHLHRRDDFGWNCEIAPKGWCVLELQRRAMRRSLGDNAVVGTSPRTS